MSSTRPRPISAARRAARARRGTAPVTAAGSAPLHGEGTRAALMTGALDAFAKHGFRAMSVRQLTRSLDVSHNIVHHHFGSKKQLWREALAFALTASQKEIVSLYETATADASADPVAVVRTMVRDAVLVYARFPSIASIIAYESAHPGERLDYLYEHFIEPSATAMQRFLKAAAPKGLRQLDGRFVVLSVMAAVPALFTHAALAKKLGIPQPPSPALIDRYAQDIAEMVVGGLLERR